MRQREYCRVKINTKTANVQLHMMETDYVLYTFVMLYKYYYISVVYLTV